MAQLEAVTHSLERDQLLDLLRALPAVCPPQSAREPREILLDAVLSALRAGGSAAAEVATQIMELTRTGAEAYPALQR